MQTLHFSRSFQLFNIIMPQHAFCTGFTQRPTICKPYNSIQLFNIMKPPHAFCAGLHAFCAGFTQGPTICKPYNQFSCKMSLKRNTFCANLTIQFSSVSCKMSLKRKAFCKFSHFHKRATCKTRPETRCCRQNMRVLMLLDMPKWA